MYQKLTAFFCFFFCFGAKSQIVINELGIAPSGGAPEFIELYNKNSCSIDLSCYTLVYSSTSGGGNATGWTIKIPSGKSVSACNYFLIGGQAGAMGVSGSTGYPTGGVVISYPIADLNIGTASITANAVYMKLINAGTLTNSSGQIMLFNSSGILVSSVSYNNGNNSATYPLSAYTTCNASGNTQGNNNIADPGSSSNNVNAIFTPAGNRGIYLNASGNYLIETSLTPGSSNSVNGGSQTGCAPAISISPNATDVCVNSNSQTTILNYSATTNAPANYTIMWDALPANNFTDVINASLPSSPIIINIPAATAAGNYTGNITVNNAAGTSCGTPFTVTIHALPAIVLSPDVTICAGSGTTLTAGGAINYSWSPSTGLSAPSGSSVTANPLSTTTYTTTGTDANGCSDSATVTVTVSNFPSAPAVVITQPTCRINTGTITITSPLNSNCTYSIDETNYQTANIFNSVAPGRYNVTVKNNNGCVSAITLANIVLPAAVIIQTADTTGCNFVHYNGINYTSSTQIKDTIKSVISNCDSIYHVTNIIVVPIPFTNINVCISQGQNYNFNGQILSTTGNYTTIYHRTNQCDSIVNLYLLVSSVQNQIINNCGTFIYNGIAYSAPAIVKDTLKSSVTGCDSIYRFVTININPVSVSSIAVCLPQGQTYNLNGTVLSSSGFYIDTVIANSGCDSIVQLHLTITKNEIINISGCASVIYSGTNYTSSVVLYQSISSLLTGCDSIIRTINIVVNAKPQLNISPGKTICIGNAATLTASAINSTIEWLGFGSGNSIVVNPPSTSTYTVVATTSNGCTDSAHVTVTVQDFNLILTANPNPVIAGRNFYLQTAANGSYQVLLWQPSLSFINQTAHSQMLVADTSLNIIVAAKSAIGCIDTAFVTVAVDPLSNNVFIPAAFTPNGDGKNDVFRILGGEIKELDLKIFNRWGEIIFSSQERMKGWDGSFKGKPQPNAVYIYFVKVVLKNGTVVTKKGTVSLIR